MYIHSECCVLGFVVTTCACVPLHIAMVVDCVSNHRDVLDTQRLGTQLFGLVGYE